MNKVLSFVITAKNKTQEGLSSAFGSIKEFATGAFKNLMNIQAGFQMLGAAAQKVYGVLKSAFAYETMTAQFKTLIGSMDEARAHMQMLKELGDTPPFSLEEFAKASRTMMVMTDNALGFKKSLEMVGDAAAATGQPVETLAHEVGRAYAIIRDGQPITRATMALRNMGVLTPEVAARLDEMQKAGASNVEIWRELESQLARFKGAMAETEQTGEGLVGAIGSRWDNAVRAFGMALLDTSKEGLSVLLDHMKKLEEDGTLAVWADRVGKAMSKAAGFIKTVADGLSTVVGWYRKLQDFMSNLGDMAGAYIGTALEQGFGSGGSNDDAWANIGQAWSDTVKERKLDAKLDAEHEQKVREEAVKKAADAKRLADKKAAEETKRIEAQLAEEQAKAEAKKAEEAAKKKAEEEEKAAKKAAEEQAKLDEKLAQERLNALEKERTARVKAAEDEYQAGEKALGDAERRLSDAEKQTAQAWGWYRDKDSMQAVIDERKAQADAEKQWEKDFAKLKSRHRDWRSIEFGKLSADEESVRQVALAREEEEAATKALEEIRENTAYLKSIAEALAAEGEG